MVADNEKIDNEKLKTAVEAISEALDMDYAVRKLKNSDKIVVGINLGKVEEAGATTIADNLKALLNKNGHAGATKGLSKLTSQDEQSKDRFVLLDADYVANNKDTLVKLFNDRKEKLNKIFPQSARDLHTTAVEEMDSRIKAAEEAAEKAFDKDVLDYGLIPDIEKSSGAKVTYDAGSKKINLSFVDEESANKFKKQFSGTEFIKEEIDINGDIVNKPIKQVDGKFVVELNAEPLLEEYKEKKLLADLQAKAILETEYVEKLKTLTSKEVTQKDGIAYIAAGTEEQAGELWKNLVKIKEKAGILSLGSGGSAVTVNSTYDPNSSSKYEVYILLNEIAGYDKENGAGEFFRKMEAAQKELKGAVKESLSSPPATDPAPDPAPATPAATAPANQAPAQQPEKPETNPVVPPPPKKEKGFMDMFTDNQNMSIFGIIGAILGFFMGGPLGALVGGLFGGGAGAMSDGKTGILGLGDDKTPPANCNQKVEKPCTDPAINPKLLKSVTAYANLRFMDFDKGKLDQEKVDEFVQRYSKSVAGKMTPEQQIVRAGEIDARVTGIKASIKEAAKEADQHQGMAKALQKATEAMNGVDKELIKLNSLGLKDVEPLANNIAFQPGVVRRVALGFGK